VSYTQVRCVVSTMLTRVELREDLSEASG